MAILLPVLVPRHQCTTVSFDLWMIDLPRLPNHKILLDGATPRGIRRVLIEIVP
jgi:hypothetical protein